MKFKYRIVQRKGDGFYQPQYRWKGLRGIVEGWDSLNCFTDKIEYARENIERHKFEQTNKIIKVVEKC